MVSNVGDNNKFSHEPVEFPFEKELLCLKNVIVGQTYLQHSLAPRSPLFMWIWVLKKGLPIIRLL